MQGFLGFGGQLGQGSGKGDFGQGGGGYGQGGGGYGKGAAIEARLDEWVQAKRSRDFTTSDAIKQELEAQGIDCDAARPDRRKLPGTKGSGGSGFDPTIEARLDEWVKEKRARNFDVSDAIQKELEAMGVDCKAARPDPNKTWNAFGGSSSNAGSMPALLSNVLASSGKSNQDNFQQKLAGVLMMAQMMSGGKGGPQMMAQMMGKGSGQKEKKFTVDKSGGELGDFTGVIKSFNHVKAYGFIECEELKNMGYGDVFLHGDMKYGYKQGQTVKFTAVINKDGKPVAIDLRSGLKP